MHHIVADCADQALVEGLWWLKTSGVAEDTRGGKVSVSPYPVFTRNRMPRRRVLLNPVRDANPFFHLFEALWMLAGQRHVAPLLHFNTRMEEFVDPGQADLHGAYGYRWMKAFRRDQIRVIVEMLKENPSTRQAVLQVWHSDYDLDVQSKDIPCNTQAYFRYHNGMLDMCVTARSNDAIWGCHGANLVHWSMLHEYIACAAGMLVGEFQQFSFNYHAYIDNPRYTPMMTQGMFVEDRYDKGEVRVSPLVCFMDTADKFLKDCDYLVALTGVWAEGRFTADPHWYTQFFQEIAGPMFLAYFRRKWGHSYELNDDYDWHVAGREWFERRDPDGSK